MKQEKNDNYKKLKPEVFEYEDFTPGLFWYSVGAIVVMIGLMILFTMFVMALFSSIGALK